MDRENIYFDLVKSELDSFSRYCFISLVLSMSLLIWLSGHEKTVSILNFELDMRSRQYAYAIAITVFLQFALLRPLAGISSLFLECKTDKIKIVLSKSPTIFNPFHEMNSNPVFLISFVLCSFVLVFFPAMFGGFVIWSWVANGFLGRSYSLIAFLISSTVLIMQVDYFLDVWKHLCGWKNAVSRLAILLIAFCAVLYHVYITQYMKFSL